MCSLQELSRARDCSLQELSSALPRGSRELSSALCRSSRELLSALFISFPAFLPSFVPFILSFFRFSFRTFLPSCVRASYVRAFELSFFLVFVRCLRAFVRSCIRAFVHSFVLNCWIVLWAARSCSVAFKNNCGIVVCPGREKELCYGPFLALSDNARKHLCDLQLMSKLNVETFAPATIAERT